MKKTILLPLTLLLLVLTMRSDAPRGIRNNNAGNLRDTGQDWQGEAGADKDGFLIFDSPVMGVRAMAKVIKNYGALYGINTIAGVVERYAPAAENDTNAYISHVAQKVGIDRHEPLLKANYVPLIKAMILHENGEQPYTDELIKKGIELAWI